MPTPTRFEREYPDLFAALPANRRASVAAALTDDRLEHGDIHRADVELLVRNATENMSDEQYLAAVLDRLHVTAST
ncbi:hypothetical protein PYV02_14830 [Leifsonia sp. H3M29-4]|jgi:hypothetical protein|uniref:hypothetical protein n=1 Tax=Salinibacterium metalliresistens TaxID=3031321 RepID=UPI0023DA5FA2|nr:hypothetical protein [Salinibacterium metalliresistens]MDF1480358.1 hypothetical protein [Salinibacterium metalliresistens]